MAPAGNEAATFEFDVLPRSYKDVVNYSKEMFTGRAKPIWIIGDPDNQPPDKWSSTVLTSTPRFRHNPKTLEGMRKKILYVDKNTYIVKNTKCIFMHK